MSQNLEDRHCYCCCQCCSWCLGNCVTSEKEKKKYARINYKLVPQTQPGLRSFVHPQEASPAVVLPQDMQELLQSKTTPYHRQPHFIVSQQPTRSSASGSILYSPHRIIPSDVQHESSPSLSDESPTPAMGQLRSMLTPGTTNEDTIDISQSPTGTFSSAYQQSQQRKGYISHPTKSSTPSRYSGVRDSSSDERDDTISLEQCSESIISDSDLTPCVKMSLYYNLRGECLSICLHSARSLPQKTSKNYSLVLHLIPEKRDTLEMKIVGDNHSPLLEQSFEIADIPRDEIRQYKLVIRLHDGSMAGKLLGKAMLPLEKTDLFGMMCSVHLDPNTDQAQGELLISLAYNPKTRVLQGILLKLTNSVLASDRSGLPDTYVKIYLVHKGKRIKHWRSSPKPTTHTLIFNEAFQFELHHKDTRHVSLDVCVMSRDRFARDDEIGTVSIGEEVQYDTGEQHWKQIVTQPNARISHWHTFTTVTTK